MSGVRFRLELGKDGFSGVPVARRLMSRACSPRGRLIALPAEQTLSERPLARICLVSLGI
jgi:hypothetical protein